MAMDFDRLVKDNLRSIRRIALSYTNFSDAEDLMQEILIQLWRSFPKFRGDSKPQTWLYRVAINTAISFQRKEIRSRMALEINELIRTQGGLLDELPQEEILKQFVKGLGDLDRAVLTLYLDGVGATEMADVLGLTANAINIRISRLKDKFGKQFVD